jgi:hypothetical protein
VVAELRLVRVNSKASCAIFRRDVFDYSLPVPAGALDANFDEAIFARKSVAFERNSSTVCVFGSAE